MKKFLKRLELQSQEALHGAGYFCLIQLLTAHQLPIRARQLGILLIGDEKRHPFRMPLVFANEISFLYCPRNSLMTSSRVVSPATIS